MARRRVEPATSLRHDFKVWPGPFARMIDGRKPADLRDLDDRSIKPVIGDVLHFREWNPKIGIDNDEANAEERAYTGRCLLALVQHVEWVGQYPKFRGGQALITFRILNVCNCKEATIP